MTPAARPPAAARPVDALPADPFTLGVASGDPRPDRVVIWTRLAPVPLAEDGRGGMPDVAVPVRWEVARDAAFTAVVAEGTAGAEPRAGHAVHVDAAGLAPATDHHYRFHAGPWTSPVGRTRTLPPEGAAVERFDLAVVNCQQLDAGSYAALRALAEEDVDVVVHLGDYVYEYPGGRARPDRVPESLDDWRLRYASYRLDPDLQAVHARHPFICTWDDHEVRDNYAGETVLGHEATPAEVRRMKADAYRAWWEHLPVRLDPPGGPELDVHHHVDVGDLARLYVLDERQWSDPPPCRGSSDLFDGGDCPERRAADRSKLGSHQERWFDEATASSAATWNLVANPQVLAGIDLGTADEPYFYLDSWDGYPRARRRLLDALARTANPVILTGDYHTGAVFDVHLEPFEPGSPVVCAEFLAPPVSSPVFAQAIGPRTPHLRQQLDAHGYLAVRVTPDAVEVRFRVVDAGDPRAVVAAGPTWTVTAGDPVARQGPRRT